MKDILKQNKYKLIGIISTLFLFIVGIGTIFGESLDNDVEVEPATDLTYYLDVKYDGVDKGSSESSDTSISSINSTTMKVEDKIPDGLTFKGFTTTPDGTIGAVQRDDKTTSCIGKVVDDTNDPSTTEGRWNGDNTEYTYHGLHYNKNTNTVTFEVKNLKAGCQLTVGIITETPSAVDDPDTTNVETRRDFYNHGNISEGPLSINSNVVHVYMGDKNATLYTVKYEYIGEVPAGAPTLERDAKYTEGTNVSVANNPNVEGYTFSGWSTTDASVSNNEFTMPNKDVTLKGSFTKIDGYNVSYEIQGEAPEDYVVPKTKEYYEGATVNVDILKPGDIINGYKFLGWTTTDVTVSEYNDFVMPNKNVKFVGQFEQIKYKVYYHFYDNPLPPNANSLLPTTKEYAPGATVNIEGNPTATGYEFLGWYKESTFEMPEEDVHIYGEWKIKVGEFEPTISKSVENPSYKVGQTAKYTVTVTNTAAFPITEVIVKENNENAKFVDGEGYTVNTDHFVTITSIPAGGSININAEYIITENTPITVNNQVEIKGALANNGYELKDKEYKASSTFNLSSEIEICKKQLRDVTENSFIFNIGDKTLTVNKGECQKIDVAAGTYNIKEQVNGNYAINKVEGAITKDNTQLVVAAGQTYKITYTNERKLDLIVHHYVNGTTTKLAEDEVSKKLYDETYETHPLTNIPSNYELVSTPDNAHGTIKNDIEVTYYYKLKEAHLKIKYLEEGTNKVLSEEKNRTVYYGEEYEAEEATDIPNNYIFKSKTENYQGIVNTNNIEVIYYYVKKDSNIAPTISKEGTNEITQKDDKVTYKITYEATFTDLIDEAEVTIVDTLPYKIDESKSNLDGGTYDDESKTINFKENFNINLYQENKKIIEKNIEVVYLDIDTKARVMTNTVKGTIKTDNKNIEIENRHNTNIKVKGDITVKYIDKETNQEIIDSIKTTDLIGENYTLEEKEFEGYKLTQKPEKDKYTYEETPQELIYYYEKIKLKVETKVKGSGGTIEGDEIVNYGQDSTKDKIKIKAQEGYFIDKIWINGEEIKVPNGLTELIMPNFIKMKENKLVEVSFKDKEITQIVDVPKTAKSAIIAVITGFILLIGASLLYYFKLGKGFNKKMKN